MTPKTEKLTYCFIIGVGICACYTVIAFFGSLITSIPSYSCPHPETQTRNDNECTAVINGTSIVTTAINSAPTVNYFLVLAVPVIIIMSIVCIVITWCFLFNYYNERNQTTRVNTSSANVEMEV